MNWREMLSYHGLSALPFGKEIPAEALQLLPSVEKNFAAARLLVDTHGIGAMVGKPGTGKSCLLWLLAAGYRRGSLDQGLTWLPGGDHRRLRGRRGWCRKQARSRLGARAFPGCDQRLDVMVL